MQKSTANPDADNSSPPKEGIVSKLGAITLDVGDIEREGAFWGAMLGEEPGPPRHGGSWLTVGSLDSTTLLVLQKVPEPKVVKNRCHMCFVVTNVDEAIRRIEALGGKRISEPRPGSGVVMEDPEGNEFCIGSFRRDKEGKRTPLG